MMDFADFLRAVFALALTLGLVGLGAVALRRFGPDALARLSAQRKERRLTVVESLVLDPTRRLVLVACDGQERLILLGDGQDSSTPRRKAFSRSPKKAPSKMDLA
jgi:flagellar protein FliO/FliZ